MVIPPRIYHVRTISVDRRDDDVPDLPLCNCLCRSKGLHRVERLWRLARLDRAESACARALAAHEHDGRGRRAFIAAPALANVGTLGFLADRLEVAVAEAATDATEIFARGDTDIGVLGEGKSGEREGTMSEKQDFTDAKRGEKKQKMIKETQKQHKFNFKYDFDHDRRIGDI